MNYARFLNPTSLARKLVISQLNKLDSESLNFADILPNSRLFPFKSAQFTLRDGSLLDLNEQTTRTALQYCPYAGNTELIKWLEHFQEYIHNPPSIRKNPHIKRKICLTSGSSEGLSQSFEMLVERGDVVLVESPTYSGIVSVLEPLGCRIVRVETDHNGVIPSRFASQLEQYRHNNNNNDNNNKDNNNNTNNNKTRKSPKFLYTVPNGGNPTGASTTHERKLHIYQLAREHDLLILEDDPYYFLQYNKPRLDSYLSMDVDGRVLRFDSYSKILSSGIRLGFVTGAEELVDEMVGRMSTSTCHASHLSQMMVLQLLKMWDMEGFERHIQTVVDFYSKQKQAMIRCAQRRLTGLAEWSEPVAGMFLWIKLLGIEDSQKLIEEKAFDKKVLLVPGCAFMPADAPVSCHVRASFSMANEESMDEGFRRLAELIREEQSSS